jgi:4-amino-4-deoxy-L-arabinose transferase-like glycosyltransferase
MKGPSEAPDGGISAGVAAAALLGVCLVVYLPPAFSTPFFTKGEAREATVVQNMVREGTWVLPRRPSATGETIASKPPMLHWLGASVATLAGGLREWTMRAPSVGLATLTVLCVWWTARALLPGAAGLLAALVLATSFEWVRAATAARVDAALAAFTTIGLLVLWRGFVHDGLTRWAAVIAGLAFGAAALTKGPVGFVLPGLVIATALVVRGRLRTLPRFHPLLAAVVVLAAVAAWYLAAWQIGGDAFFRKHVLKENVFRFVGATALKSGHAHPFYYYVPALAVGLLPWTPMVVGALVAVVRDRTARRDPRTGFLLMWFVVTFVFYSAASAKRSVYLLALYPPAALLAGWWLEALVRSGRPFHWLDARPARIALGVLGLVLAIPLVLVLAEGVGLAPLAHLAPLLHEKDRANLPLVREVIGAHLGVVVIGMAVLLAALVATALWVLVFGVFQPGLATRRTLAPFMAEVRTLTGGVAPYFYPPTFDHGAAFYGDPPPLHWGEPGVPTAPDTYVLIWDVDLAALAAEHRASLAVLATSTGTDPKGKRRMVLARLR